MAVTLTTSAQQRVQNYLERRGHGVGLRLGVKDSGCSGWAYTVDYADESMPDDLHFQSGEVLVLVDPVSLPYVDGTEIDFVQEGLNSSFKFNNPNVTDECGCGTSFAVTPEND